MNTINIKSMAYLSFTLCRIAHLKICIDFLPFIIETGSKK